MPKIHPQKIFVRGEEWTILDRRMRHYGWCFYSYDGTDPVNEIWIRSDIVGREALNTIVHEVIHGCQPDLSEAAVDEIASDLETILWDLGYRNEDWD